MTLDDPECPERLWHYTSGSGAKAIFQSQTLWAGHLAYMNDTSEVNQAFDVSVSVATRLRRELPEHEVPLQRWIEFVTDDPPSSRAPNVFAVSFSEEPDLLSQWRGYATGHGGPVSIGFPSAPLRQRLHIGEETDWILRKCIYSREEQDALIESRIRHVLPLAASAETLRPGESREDRAWQLTYGAVTNVAPFCKHPDFAEEREWRLVYGPADPTKVARVHFVERQYTLAPYIEFRLTEDATPLDDVSWIVGPGPQQERASPALAMVARHAGMTRFQGRLSETPYLP